MTRHPVAMLAALMIAVLGCAGCALLLGFEDHEPFPEENGGSGGTTSTGGAGFGGAGGGHGGGGDGGAQGGGSGGGMPLPGGGWVGLSNANVMMQFRAGMVLSSSADLLPFGSYPYDATIHPTRDEIWVVGAVGDGIVIVSSVTNEVIDTIALTQDSYPVDVLFSKNGTAAYVSARDTEELVIINVATRTISDSVSLSGRYPGKMSLNPCTDTVWMVEWYGDTLFEVDPILKTLSPTTNVGVNLWDLVVHPDGATVYVTDRGQDRLRIVDTATTDVTASITVGQDPWGVAITPDGSTVVVASEDSAMVHFVDTASNQATSLQLPTDAKPRDVDITDNGAYAYLPSGQLPGNPAVYEIYLGSRTLTDVIDLGDVGASANPNVIAVSPPAVVCQP